MVVVAVMVSIAFHLTPFALKAQAPGTTPVEVSHETQMLHGRKYYVHIVKTGQTVYSIAKAYKVQSYDAVTHVDIHYMHAGDTVWLPARGQFSEAAKEIEENKGQAEQNTPSKPSGAVNENGQKGQNGQSDRAGVATQPSQTPQAPPTVRPTGKVLKVALLMPLHLDQLEDISTSKFDIEQRGKKSYRQFEFIEFYEGMQMALEKLAAEGVSVELNVVDVNDNSVAKVEEAFASRNVAQSDVIVALLLRDAFDKAAELARQAGVYIVNPMATRSELCAENPYMVKMQPSLKSQVQTMLTNMKLERPDAHLYVIHSNVKAEKAVMEEVKRQLDERGDIQYTIFNWSQSSKLAGVLKKTPGCNVLSIYDQGRDLNRVYAGNLLNRLSAIKSDSPTLYTLVDWTREYSDIDFNQLQLLSYHTFSTSWDMGNEIHVAFLRDFRTRYGSEPTSGLAATGYDLTLYIVDGLSRHGAEFWRAPVGATTALTQPIRLGRNGAGLENGRITLYKMDNLRFVPAQRK